MTIKANVLYVDGHQTAILDREGVLPVHVAKQIKKAYAKSLGIGDWNYPYTDRSITLKYVEPAKELPRYEPQKT